MMILNAVARVGKVTGMVGSDREEGARNGKARRVSRAAENRYQLVGTVAWYSGRVGRHSG